MSEIVTNESASQRGSKRLSAVFAAVALAGLCVPTISMAFGEPWMDPSANAQFSAPQVVTTTGAPNLNVLADAGDYFEARFPLRGDFIAATSTLKAGIFQSASSDQVIIGKDGYLFYSGTLNDYLGFNQLSERDIDNAAYNLALLHQQLAARGIGFVVAIAPNKNTLYPQYLPARYLAADRSASNLSRLQATLDDYGVPTVDLQGVLAGDGEPRYLRTDTHWDYRGAHAAAAAILQQLGVPSVTDNPDWQPATGFVGDIATMLDPGATQPEANWAASGINDEPNFTGKLWRYETASGDEAAAAAAVESADVTNQYFETSGAGEKSVFVFRDSFGNSLVPMLAPNFKTAYFSKLVPYDMAFALAKNPDAIVVERAERHAAFFATDPPAMPSPVSSLRSYTLREDSPQLGVEQSGTRDGTASGSHDAGGASITANGAYWMIDGQVPAQLRRPDVAVYARVTDAGNGPASATVTDFKGWRRSVPDDSGAVASDYGYRFYLSQDVAPSGAQVELYAVSSEFGAEAYLVGKVEIPK